MDNIIIRKATLDDLQTLLLFEQGVIQAERPMDSTLKLTNIKYYDIKQLITAAHIELIVAESNQQLVGSGYARIEEVKPYLQHQQHAYLGFMYVLPEFRGQGINGLVVQELKKWSKKQGVTELRLDVYFENPGAIRAYEKEGFSKHMIEMRMNLKDL